MSDSRHSTDPPAPRRKGRGEPIGGIATFGFHHPFIMLAIVALLSVIAVQKASRLVLDPDISRMLPEEAPSVRNLEHLQVAFGGTGYVSLLLSGSDAKTLVRYADTLVPRLRRMEGVRYVELRRPVAFFKDRLGYYLTLRDLEKIDRRVQRRIKWETLHADPLFVDLEETKPPPIEIQDIVDRHRKQTEKKRYFVKEDPFVRDENGRRLLIQVRPTLRSTDLHFSQRLVARIRSLVRKTTVDEFASVQVAVSGRYTKRVEQQESIVSDLRLSGTVAAMLLMLFLVLHLRSVRSTVVVMAPLFVGVLWSLGWAGWMVGSLNLLSAFVGVILLGIGVDHGLHLMGRYQDDRCQGLTADLAVRNSFSRTGRGVLIAGLTTAASFVVLAASDFRGFREFGIIAGGGLVMQVLAYLILLPSLIALDERLPRRRWSPPRNLLLPFYRRIRGWAPAAVWITVVGVLAITPGLSRVRFQYDFAALNRSDLPSTRTDQEVNSLLGHSQTPLVILAPDDAAARAVGEEIRNRQHKRPFGVDFVLTISDFVPAQQAKKHRLLKKIATALDEADPEDMKPRDRKRLMRLKKMAAEPPFDAAALPVSIRRMFHPPRHRSSAVLVFPSISLSDGKRVRTLARGLRNVPLPGGEKTVTAAGEAMLLADILDRIIRTAPNIMGLTALVVLGIIALLTLSWRTFIIVLTAPVLTLAITVSLMPVVGLKFNYLNVVMIPVLFGMSVDGAVHLALHAEQPSFFPSGLAAVSRSIAGSIITTMISLGALLLAHHPGLRSLALLALLGNAVNLGVCLVFVTGLLALLDVIQAKHRSERQPATSSEAAPVTLPRAHPFSLVSTVGGAGYSGLSPGTLGAVVALPVTWALTRLAWPPRIGVLLLMTLVSSWCVARYIAGRSSRDPQEVVVDEFVGMLIAATFIEWAWPWLLAAFVLFRLFDIWKPWIIRTVDERWSGALGVMGDDVLAGLAAGGLLLAIRLVISSPLIA